MLCRAATLLCKFKPRNQGIRQPNEHFKLVVRRMPREYIPCYHPCDQGSVKEGSLAMVAVTITLTTAVTGQRRMWLVLQSRARDGWQRYPWCMIVWRHGCERNVTRSWMLDVWLARPWTGFPCSQRYKLDRQDTHREINPHSMPNTYIRCKTANSGHCQQDAHRHVKALKNSCQSRIFYNTTFPQNPSDRTPTRQYLLAVIVVCTKSMWRLCSSWDANDCVSYMTSLFADRKDGDCGGVGRSVDESWSPVTTSSSDDGYSMRTPSTVTGSKSGRSFADVGKGKNFCQSRWRRLFESPPL